METLARVTLIALSFFIATSIGYGMFSTAPKPLEACLKRPWLDLTHGC